MCYSSLLEHGIVSRGLSRLFTGKWTRYWVLFTRAGPAVLYTNPFLSSQDRRYTYRQARKPHTHATGGRVTRQTAPDSCLLLLLLLLLLRRRWPNAAVPCDRSKSVADLCHADVRRHTVHPCPRIPIGSTYRYLPVFFSLSLPLLVLPALSTSSLLLHTVNSTLLSTLVPACQKHMGRTVPWSSGLRWNNLTAHAGHTWTSA